MVVPYEVDHVPRQSGRVRDRNRVQLGAGKSVAVRGVAGRDRDSARRPSPALVGTSLDQVPGPVAPGTPGRTAAKARRPDPAQPREEMKAATPIPHFTRDQTAQRADALKLWKRYARSGPGSKTEDELVNQYLPLVRTVVGRLAMTLPAHAATEDLYSAG